MSAYCEACEMSLPTRRDADYHRTECHAFVEQIRDELRRERDAAETNARFDPARAADFNTAWKPVSASTPDHLRESQEPTDEDDPQP